MERVHRGDFYSVPIRPIVDALESESGEDALAVSVTLIRHRDSSTHREQIDMATDRYVISPNRISIDGVYSVFVKVVFREWIHSKIHMFRVTNHV